MHSRRPVMSSWPAHAFRDSASALRPNFFCRFFRPRMLQPNFFCRFFGPRMVRPDLSSSVSSSAQTIIPDYPSAIYEVINFLRVLRLDFYFRSEYLSSNPSYYPSSNPSYYPSSNPIRVIIWVSKCHAIHNHSKSECHLWSHKLIMHLMPRFILSIWSEYPSSGPSYYPSSDLSWVIIRVLKCH